MSGDRGGRAGRPRVLVLIGAMWPGNDSSGPNRSVKGLCEALSDRFDFRLLARSGPPGGRLPPAGSSDWIDRDFAHIRYLPTGRGGASGLIRAVRGCGHDALLMNSVWDRDFTLPVLAARRAGILPRDPAIISTRGEFSTEALALKPVRKRIMRLFLRASGALENIVLHATSDIERSDVAAAFPKAPILVAPNVRPVPAALPHSPPPDGKLRAVFLGRISRVKGLDIALSALAECKSDVGVAIWGPAEDRAYLDECRAIAARVPANIMVEWKGVASADDIPTIFASSDILLMPSHSENFGHAIFEAFAAGVPVMVGPSTPWQDLETRRAGTVLPLEARDAWAGAIDRFASLFPDRRAEWAAGARSVAEAYAGGGSAASRWEDAIRSLVARRSPA